MYGRTEHRYYVRRLGDVNRGLDCQREIVATLIQEARADFTEAHERAMSLVEHHVILELASVRSKLAETMQAVDKAVALLPTPVAS